jgi:hypothetical protein
MDRFRVSALEKMLESGALGPEDKQATVDMLVEKCRILALGAQKRGHADRVEYYSSLAARYTTPGASLD